MGFRFSKEDEIDDNFPFQLFTKHSYVLDWTVMDLKADPITQHQEETLETPFTINPELWHLQNKGFIPSEKYETKEGADAKIVKAWEVLGNRGNSEITIAISDNGFDLEHPDLQGNIVYPFDVWNRSDHIKPNHSFNHGTATAGLALANSSEGTMIGGAPNSKFMPLQGTSFAIRDIEQVFNRCIKFGADVVICPWGTTKKGQEPNEGINEIIKQAATEGRRGLGCVIVFPVGNEGLDNINHFAKHPDVIAVSASTSKDEHAKYANRGMEISVCAPSNGDYPLLSTKAAWDKGHWFSNKPKANEKLYKHTGGTAAACAIVGSVCALILSANPNLTAHEVKLILKNTADKIGKPSDYNDDGYSTKYGFGRVNAYRAVLQALEMKG